MPQAKYSVGVLAAAGIFFVLTCIGCSSSSAENAGRTASDQELIDLGGTINAQSVAAIEGSIARGARRLRVRSLGGRIPDAIRLGKMIRSHDVEVIVDGACFSACAHFVFAPARRKRLEPNALVAFHGTATSRWQSLRTSGRSDLAKNYEAVAQAEQDFYKNAGLSENLLLYPANQIEPMCFVVNNEVPEDSEFRAGIVSRFTFFIPSTATLTNFNVGSIEGDWPVEQADVRAALVKLPRGLQASFKLEHRGGAGIWKMARPSMPECPPELRVRRR